MDFMLIAVAVLGAIGLIAALVLYVCSKKFYVYEDPRIAQVTEQLPGANCGGCGFAGCGGLADALVKGADAGSLDGLMCPVGGQEVMGKVADLLGMAIANGEPKVAVVRCNGTCALRPKIAEYRLCGCLPVRCYPHEPRDGSARGRRGEVYLLRCLCEGLSAQYHRVAQEGSEGPSRIRIVCQQGQGSCGHEGL